MSKKSACPDDKKQRDRFLRENGFVTVKEYNHKTGARKCCSGKGSHEAWVHLETAFTIIMPMSPAVGTWLKIQKRALEACAQMTRDIQHETERALKQQEKMAHQLFKAWKRACKLNFKGGLPPPPPPTAARPMPEPAPRPSNHPATGPHS